MRVFVAIELTRPVKRVMLNVIDKLSEFRSAVRWVREEQMHLTMKFLGDVPDQHVPEVCDTCEHVAGACEPFDLMVDRCGCFPRNGRVRVIWCGSTDGSSAATVCASRLEDAFAELGFERESRPFSPHMTLGRVRDDRTRGRLRDAVEHIQPGTATQRVDELTVFQSILSSQGPRYTALGRFRLGGQR